MLTPLWGAFQAEAHPLVHPQAVLRHQPQLSLLYFHNREVVEARFNVQQSPEVSLSGLIYNVGWFLDGIARLLGVGIEFYTITA